MNNQILNVDNIHSQAESVLKEKRHPLVENFHRVLSPQKFAWDRLGSAISHVWAKRNFSGKKRVVVFDREIQPNQRVHLANRYFQDISANLSKTDETSGSIFSFIDAFAAAMAAFTSSCSVFVCDITTNKKTSRSERNYAQKQLAMLPNLLVLGPITVFNSSNDSNILTKSYSHTLAQFGADILRNLEQELPDHQMPPQPFHKLRLFFLQYLNDVGLGNINSEKDLDSVDWKYVVEEFNFRFTEDNILTLFELDIELALKGHHKA